MRCDKKRENGTIQSGVFGGQKSAWRGADGASRWRHRVRPADVRLFHIDGSVHIKPFGGTGPGTVMEIDAGNCIALDGDVPRAPGPYRRQSATINLVFLDRDAAVVRGQRKGSPGFFFSGEDADGP